MIRAIVIALLLAFALPSAAHEPAGGRTELSLRGGRYSIEMSVETLTALNQLELDAGVPLSYGLQPEALDRALSSRAAALASAAIVRIDGERVAPRMTLEPIGGGDSSKTLVTFSGVIPPRARTMQWAWTLASSPYRLVVRQGASDPVIHVVDGGAPSPIVELQTEESTLTRAAEYLRQGFLHIVPLGLDHILFVLGLFFFSTRVRDVVVQASIFTIAHSLTLALSIFDLVRLPPAIVEPLIALSIVFVAVENLVAPNALRPRRYALVFAFGLLHGLGFAGVLSDIGLPGVHRVVALLAFNAGVELGQLAVIAAAFLLIASWSRKRTWYRAAVANPISIAIGAMGLWWTLERVGDMALR